jgi:hypothetical protein
MTRRHLLVVFVLVAAGLVLEAAPLHAQCAMCRTALTQSAEGRAMSGSFNRAILLMLVAPYAVFAVVGAALFRDRIRSWARRLVRR